MLTVIAELFVERYFEVVTAERKRLRTLRNVIRFAAQALGFLFILVWIFGPPSQMATVLALAGAGLTVAPKDFIVRFFGWFVLMGRNGIHLGDWVEINRVGGEVVEIDLLHTVLLETGNWTDGWHPTGRHVSFVNSYVIESHYFNFSTSASGFGMSYKSSCQPVKIRKRSRNRNGRRRRPLRMHTSKGTPGVSVRPTAAGIEVTVRYITRATERDEVRARLYRAVVELLQQKQLPQPTMAEPTATR